MKSQWPHRTVGILFAAAFALNPLPNRAESHCPANITNLHPRLVAGALLVIPVKVNGSGPYDFMVDTGNQLNLIDPGLAARLQVKPQGTVGVFTTSAFSHASVVVLDSLEAGSERVSGASAIIEDLGPIQAADPGIRGILGENFLAHFDVFIDYWRGLLCLDASDTMGEILRGERIPLVPRRHPETEMSFSPRLVISAKLSGAGSLSVLLQLDSGSSGQLLFAENGDLEQAILRHARLQRPEAGELSREYAILPPQDLRIGTRVIRNVSFVTPVHAERNVPDREEDGLLSTTLFQRIYISHTDHYAIFNPR